MKNLVLGIVLLRSVAVGFAESVIVDDSRCIAPVVVTATNTGNNQLLYFTSPSLTADDKHLVFISDRTGNPNLFMSDLVTGDERQLTTNTEGVLKAYVYFDGTPYRGIGKGSVSLDPQSGTVYYIRGREVRAVKLNGETRLLAILPTNQMTAFTHVSADGKRLCVPTTDARALDEDKQLKGKPNYDIDVRVQREHLVSYIRVFDTTTGKQIACEPVTNAWVTHVQFSPVDSNLILYNHEWCSQSGIRRMWLWNGKTHLRLRTEGDGRNADDWTCHEMWERDGSAIIYHGNFTNGVSYVGRVFPDGSGRVEIPLPADWNHYGHFTVGNPGEMVTDGCYQEVADKKWGGSWISLLKVDWAQGRIRWFPIAKHGSTWRSQDEHPHPVFSHAADAIWFTSDKDGKRAVYRIPLSSMAGGVVDLTTNGVQAIMRSVADWQLANPSKHLPDDWTQGAGYAGMMALAELSQDAKYRDAMVAMGETNQWRLGKRKFHADDHTVGQAYVELFLKSRDERMIAPMRAQFDDILAHPSDAPSLNFRLPKQKSQELWSWCDALFMSPPAWLRLAKATGDQRYRDFAVNEWWRTSDYLYDTEEHLYFRDSTYFNKREANGRKVFWSRGNGWVMGGLVRSLQYLAKDDPARPRFEQQFKEMAATIIKCQQADGLWRASLLDPESYPLKETSGSGFYGYALAWGINNGLLDRAAYEPVVRRAWSALVACVDADGKLTHVQPIGADPRKFDENATEIYGVGALLLAGSEVCSLARITKMDSSSNTKPFR